MAKTIEDLPNEMLLQIFSYCSVEDMVLYVQHVCTHWYELAQDAELWKWLSYFPRRGVPTEHIIAVLENAPNLKSIIFLENVDETLINAVCTYCPEIELLAFYDTQPVTTEMLENILKFLPKLFNLTLRSMDIDSQQFAVVLGRFHNLKKLSLLHTFYTGSELVKCIADGCNSLEYLQIDGLDVSDRNIQYFISKKGPQLTGLVLDGYRLSAACLSQISLCTKLQKFMFHDCTALTEPIFSDIVRLPKLRQLQLISPMYISSKTLASSLRHDSLRQLVALDLTRSNLDDEGANNLSETCQNLKSLTLAMCFYISDEAMRYISRCTKLQYLNIKSCELTDTGMSFLPNLRRLMYLNISRNDVTDKGMSYVMKCSQLTTLQINYCLVSAETIKEVSSTLKLLVTFNYMGCRSYDSDNSRKLPSGCNGYFPRVCANKLPSKSVN